MSLVVMGISHKTASIEQRSHASISEHDIPSALLMLKDNPGIKESLILSTCNRVEVYVDAKTDRLGADALDVFFRSRMAENFDESLFYLFRGQDTVQHTFRVVCSLDSQLLGEAQILAQMRHAYELAAKTGTCGETLEKLFKSAFRLGKQVRTETNIGSGSVSLSTAAYKVACEHTTDITRSNVLLIGSGEMAQLTAKYLLDGGVASLSVATRTPSHAAAFAQKTGANIVPFGKRAEAVAKSDVVFSMTSATDPVVCSRDLEDARAELKTSENHLVLIDEAVPRDIEPQCACLPGVELFDLEALNQITDASLARRMESVAEVERLISQAEEDFLSWMQQRLVVPSIKAIYEKGEYTVQHELTHAVKDLEKQLGAPLSSAEQKTLEAYGNAVMKKILHGPTIRLRKEAQTADSYYYTGAARYLFGIETYPPGTHHHCKDRRCLLGKPCPNGLSPAMQKVCVGSREDR